MRLEQQVQSQTKIYTESSSSNKTLSQDNISYFNAAGMRSRTSRSSLHTNADRTISSISDRMSTRTSCSSEHSNVH